MAKSTVHMVQKRLSSLRLEMSGSWDMMSWTAPKMAIQACRLMPHGCSSVPSAAAHSGWYSLYMPCRHDPCAYGSYQETLSTMAHSFTAMQLECNIEWQSYSSNP